jgi:predicted protein tyrosine phosphatase
LLDHSTHIISISTTDDSPARLPKGIKHLRVFFDDVNDDQDNQIYADPFDGHRHLMHAMSTQQAKDIVRFAKDAYRDGCELLIVHCSAGISRSAGVAIALADGFRDTVQAANLARQKPNYNRDIYKKITRVF